MLHDLTVPAEAAGTRLDVWLESALEGCSRSLVARCVREGRCAVDGVAEHKVKPALRLRGGEAVTIEVDELPAVEAVPEDLPLTVLHEDAHCIVLDKPAGMVVHPAPGNLRGTLVNGLLGRWRLDGPDAARPGVVHRLDQHTSGVILVAKTLADLEFFQSQWRERRVDKRYLALVAGRPRSDLFEHDGWLGRHPRDFRKRAVLPAGTGDAREAYTRFLVRERHDAYAVVEARPRTGRTHQIRVHAAACGHPILADAVYGRSPQWPLNGPATLARQALHAWRLTVPMPGGGEAIFHAALPADLRPFISDQRLQALG